jgi:hypothetical protein
MENGEELKQNETFNSDILHFISFLINILEKQNFSFQINSELLFSTKIHKRIQNRSLTSQLFLNSQKAF